MRKIVCLTSLMLAFIMLSGCGIGYEFLKLNNSDPAILDEYIDKEEHFDDLGWMDYTDYCKYIYSQNGKELFRKSKLYNKVESCTKVKKYIEDFREWMEAADRLDDFDLKAEQVTRDDFYRIEDNRPETDSYSLYFFDSKNNTLYYCHSKW